MKKFINTMKNTHLDVASGFMFAVIGLQVLFYVALAFLFVFVTMKVVKNVKKSYEKREAEENARKNIQENRDKED